MLIVFFRAIVIFIFLLIVMRLMGKKQLGELQPFEFAVTLIVAELACVPMSDSTMPISYGIVPMFTLFILHLIVTKITKSSIHLRKIINGKPIIVIDNNGINHKTIKMLDLTINDLMESLRSQGYFSPSEIKYAIVETNGDLSVMPKSANRPPTVSELSLQVEETDIPYMLICEGKKLNTNIQLSGVRNDFIPKICEKFKLKVGDIYLLTVQNNDKIYLQPTSKKYIESTVEEVYNG